MKSFVWRLEFLCLEVLSKNIGKYCEISEENWKLRYVNNLGERLIHATIINAHPDQLREVKTFKFILNNFFVKNLGNFGKIFQEIEYFDFLNEKHFDGLTIDINNDIKLRDDTNDTFRLSTNQLKLYYGQTKNNLYKRPSYEFFSSLYAVNEIVIVGTSLKFIDNKQLCLDMEKVIIRIVENASENLENLLILFKPRTKTFLSNFYRVIKKKNNLKYVLLEFIGYFDRPTIIDLYHTVFNNLTKFTINNLKYNWNVKTIMQCLKSMYSIEDLTIELVRSDIIIDKLDEVKYLFATLYPRILKKLKVKFLKYDHFSAEFLNFLKHCRNLESFEYIERQTTYNLMGIYEVFLPTNMKDADFINVLRKYSKNLTQFILKSFLIGNMERINSLERFFTHSSITEIQFVKNSFYPDYFVKFLQTIRSLNNQLTSLEIIDCNIPSFGELCAFSEFIKDFTKLKKFHFKNYIIENVIFFNFFKNLINSNETLEVIIIERERFNFREPLDIDCFEDLLEFFRRCIKLRIIQLRLTLTEDKILEVLSVIQKFENQLEEMDVSFCYSTRYVTELINFLLRCNRLHSITGDSFHQTPDWIRVRDSFEKSRYHRAC